MFNFSFLVILSIISSTNFFPQNKLEFNSELFRINVTGNLLIVNDNYSNKIYAKEFQKPSAYSLDLDRDGNDEFIVKDLIESGSSREYFFYVFNLLDTFYLAGEINSGFTEPYETFSGEIEGLIIVSGNDDFSYLNEESDIKSLPINCWKFEDGDLFLVNEELYDIFIAENDTHLSMIYSKEINNCDKSREMKSLLATVYINYISAGDNAAAENFLETFYLCNDRTEFNKELNILLNEPEE